MTRLCPYNELHIYSIFTTIFNNIALNCDIMEYIYSYLMPDESILRSDMLVMYETNIHNSCNYYMFNRIELVYYDFICKCARHMWASSLSNNKYLFPRHYYESDCFRYGVDSIHFIPLPYAKMYMDKLPWMVLFMELACDFKDSCVFYSTYDQSRTINIRELNTKYLNWFANC
jgi:hypothetical protein